MIGKPKDTIIDRSIIINLSRKRADEFAKKLKVSYCHNSLDIRRKLKRWAQDNEQSIRNSQVKVPDLGNDRMADNWEPLFAIAENIGWVEKAKGAMRCLAKLHDDDESIGIMLLQDIQKIFLDGNIDRIFSEDLVNKLIALEDKPWGEWYRGHPITPNSLARQLKHFGINSKTIRIDTITKKGYDISRFQESFSRYIPPKQTVTPSQANNNNKLDHFQTVTETQKVTDEKQDNYKKSLERSVVTDVMPTSGVEIQRTELKI